MYNVKLPENMEWRKPKEPTPCVEPGWYAWRFGSHSGLTYCQQGTMLGEGYELAGPIEFDIPTPLPEPVKFKGHCKTEITKLSGRTVYDTDSINGMIQVIVSHPDQHVAVLAHNAAIKIIQEHTNKGQTRNA